MLNTLSSSPVFFHSTKQSPTFKVYQNLITVVQSGCTISSTPQAGGGGGLQVLLPQCVSACGRGGFLELVF